MKKQTLQRLLAGLLAGTTLYLTAVTTQSESPAAALTAVRQASLPQELLRWELGGLWGDLSLSTLLVLHQMPLLAATMQHHAATPQSEDPSDKTDTADGSGKTAESATPTKPNIPDTTLPDDLTFADNGAPAETVIPTTTSGYCVINGVFIKSSSVQTIHRDTVAAGDFAAKLTDDAPQVLILHTHGSEAYTMPKGDSYEATGEFRTADARYSVIRVGDEIASVLSKQGISVLHDRSLYDTPYDGAYERSMASIEAYKEKYPSLVYILDIHRDAIEDADGRQYKVVCQEEPHAAQVSLVMGSDFDGWEENLTLAVAVQQTVNSHYPTLMRPLTLRNSGYNQEASPGSMLVEIGAAGNSLDEAIYAGRLFAQSFAETILRSKS